MQFLQRQHRLLFYCSWILLAGVQAYGTQLLDDEAYYWVYAQFPAWGYMDHPPMIALMIKTGYALLPNELGVRLISILMNAGTLLLIEKMICPKKPYLFYQIIFSILLLQVGGFLAVPDIPLLFFTSLLLFVYRRCLDTSSIKNNFLLGVTMALLMYSKYHGFLVILFILLSNLSLFRKPVFYVAVFTGLLLYTPHVYWLYAHDWVSLRYQLLESNRHSYRLSFTTDYIGGQLLLAGPLAGILLLPAAFLQKPGTDLFLKALRYLLQGIYAFFFLSSFRGQVEANWTSPAMIPLIILAYHFLSQQHQYKITLRIIFFLSLALGFFFRIAMLVDFVPIRFIRQRFHSWQHWPEEMKQHTRGLPVVWNSSYQRASQYWFHTGQLCYSLNAYRDRRNNYDYWPIQNDVWGKPVVNMDVYNFDRFSRHMQTPIGTIGYRFEPRFYSLHDIRFQQATVSAGDASHSFFIETRLSVPAQTAAFLASAEKNNIRARIGVFDKNGWIKDIPFIITGRQLVNGKKIVFAFSTPLAQEKSHLRIALQWKDYPPTRNSADISITRH